ncbi:hypothetical protein IKE97_01600 [Candidatus Saccharibacteria bacterium]|nr:hypothetical protein [Candidatus Saccharibacteria bacterium]
MTKRSRKTGIIKLVILLLLVVGGGLLFIGAVSGWFNDSKVVLDAEYDCADDCSSFIEVGADQYEDLINEQKSFIVLVDQGGCKTADRLRNFMGEWAKENHERVVRMMFSEMKETSLHEFVKYYPSVVIIGKGEVKAYLKADSDEDAEKYNSFDTLDNWIRAYVSLK